MKFISIFSIFFFLLIFLFSISILAQWSKCGRFCWCHIDSWHKQNDNHQVTTTWQMCCKRIVHTEFFENSKDTNFRRMLSNRHFLSSSFFRVSEVCSENSDIPIFLFCFQFHYVFFFLQFNQFPSMNRMSQANHFPEHILTTCLSHSFELIYNFEIVRHNILSQIQQSQIFLMLAKVRFTFAFNELVGFFFFFSSRSHETIS